MLQRAERELLGWAADLSDASDEVQRLTLALFGGGAGADAGPGPRSTLNNDGSPVQVCVTVAPGARRVRIIGDPTAAVRGHASRAAAADEAIGRVFAAAGADALAEVGRRVVGALLPAAAPAELDAGLCWIAAGVGGGAAAYINTSWGAPGDRWSDARAWLLALLPSAAPCTAVLAAIERHAQLASIGVEGRAWNDARVKCYWRLARPVALADLGLEALQAEPLVRFLALLDVDRRLPLSGLVWSAGFALGDGRLTDVKVDVCGHCVSNPPSRWTDLFDRCCNAYGLPAPDLADGLEARRGEVAFVGVGAAVGAPATRLNVYLKVPEDGDGQRELAGA